MMRRIALAWLCLLVLSNIYRISHPVQPTARADQRLVTVAERIGAKQTERHIAIAIREYGSSDDRRASVILLHGTPIASNAMRALANEMAPSTHIISPDLPGFASSSQPLADYSSITHGLYVGDLMERLGIERAHLVAYSQGGAAAIALADAMPDRIASISLVSAIGVQELELFGSYALNHSVYTGQLWLVNSLRWLIPHFGYLDDAALGTGYARNLADTDQRVLRPMLKRIDMPTLIVHGRSDGLVPYSAALEHHRLLAQSELITLAGGHELAYARPALVAPSILEFLEHVEAGTAKTRNQASMQRQAAALAPMGSIDREPLLGFALLVLCLAIIVASYVSEDLTCIAAGLLVAQGIITFPVAVLACLIGLFTGDLALFAAGRWMGPPALRRLVRPARLARATAWLNRRGPWVIIASRFVPGTRLPTYVAAGALHMPVWRFTGYFALATAIWTPILVGLAYAYGEIANQWFSQYANATLPILLGGALAIWLASRIVPPMFSWRGRRLLYSRWQRATRFEFWPRSVFYPPIALYCLWLALRFRSLTLFTLANPGIPLGGLLGESKTDILSALSGSGHVAAFVELPGGSLQDRLNVLDTFTQTQGQGYPMVLKPVHGERGHDVVIVHERTAAVSYLDTHPDATIAQRYVAGQEYGVFYIRMPDADEGFIYSLTHKGTTEVTGDGVATLEQLILGDARAVCMANFFLDEHAQRLSQVVPAGQRMALNRIGTHSRGSLFTNAGALNSEALRKRIDDISRQFEGFYFGRYDLIAPSGESLRHGEQLYIVELNGVSSEATHIYHPGTSVWSGWRVIARQWRYAFEIGAVLRRQGLRPIGPIHLIRELVKAA